MTEEKFFDTATGLLLTPEIIKWMGFAPDPEGWDQPAFSMRRQVGRSQKGTPLHCTFFLVQLPDGYCWAPDIMDKPVRKLRTVKELRDRFYEVMGFRL